MMFSRDFLYYSRIVTLFIIFCISYFIYVATATASPLVFRGQNSAIFPDANPSGAAGLMNSVRKPPNRPATTPAIDPTRLIIQGLESQITNKIYNDIFNTTTVSELYRLPGGGRISFLRPGDGNIEITIVDAAGTTSVIVVPDI